MFADKLRKSLLQAAIQGQLTEQLPTDGDARDLLKKIRDEKAKLIKAKKIKAERPLPPVTDDEIPFELPANWCWCRLGDIGVFISGYTPKSDELTTDGKIPYFKVADMNTKGNEIWMHKTNLYLKTDSARTYEKNTIVYPKNGGAVLTNKKRILRQDSVVDLNTGGYKVMEPINLMYLFNFFLTINFKLLYKGTALPTLDNKRLQKFLFPLPPLAEQLRIVERLNALLSEVAELAKDERELNLHVKNFPRKMKNSLLQAAIQGQLTEQLPTDGDARDLLKKIRDEKAKLIAAKKIKAEKPLPPVTDDEIPFELPANWCWCRLGEVCQINPRNKPNDENIDATFLPMTSINEGYDSGYNPLVRPWTEIKSGFTHFADGDVILAKITPCFQNRKSALVSGLKNRIGAGTTELYVFRSYGKHVDGKYLLYFVKNQQFISDGLATMKGTAGQQRVSRDFIANYLFPLPPYAEQERIVERLNELLPLCEI